VVRPAQARVDGPGRWRGSVADGSAGPAWAAAPCRNRPALNPDLTVTALVSGLSNSRSPQAAK